MWSALAAVMVLIAPPEGAGRPFEALAGDGGVPAAVRQTVSDVFSRARLIREIRSREFSTRMEIMDALFDHPPLTAGIVRGMDLGDFHVSAAGDGYDVREGRSIEAEFVQIYRRDGLRLYRIRGQYYGTFFIHLSGEALLLARYDPAPGGGVTVKADAALCVDNRFYGFLVYLFAPLFDRLVDGRFASYMEIARKLSESLAADPEGVYNRLAGLGVLSEEEQEQFRHLFAASKI